MLREGMKNTRKERQMFGATVRFIDRKIRRLQKPPVRALMVCVAKPNAAKPEPRVEGMWFLSTKRRFPQLALRALEQGFLPDDTKALSMLRPRVSCREEKTDDRSA